MKKGALLSGRWEDRRNWFFRILGYGVSRPVLEDQACEAVLAKAERRISYHGHSAPFPGYPHRSSRKGEKEMRLRLDCATIIFTIMGGI